MDSKGIGAWIILNLFGTYKKLATSKFFLKFMNDKSAFEKSLSLIFSLDFDNVILAHGSNIIGNGEEKLRSALAERGLKPT